MVNPATVEVQPQQLANRGIVFDDEHAAKRCRSGHAAFSLG
jgi:hypothetical protein